MMRILSLLVFWIAALVTAAFTAFTFAGLSNSNLFWVRMTEFPRAQYVVVLAVCALAALLARPHGRRAATALAAVAALAIGYNALRLHPYFLASGIGDNSCTQARALSILVSNVKLGNRQAGDLIALVRERQPDLFVALETDDWWDEAFTALDDQLPHTIQELTGSYFGMHLMSRLPLDDVETIFPVEQDAPAIRATVATPEGPPVQVVAIHPRPPQPGQPSTGRDAQLIWAARRAAETDGRVIVAGDLNAVPWERTVELMQRVGGLIDPRRETGFVATYKIGSWIWRWPLDQILYGETLRLTELTRLEDIGSDHWPVEATFCIDTAARPAPDPRPGDPEAAQRIIDAALAGRPEPHQPE